MKTLLDLILSNPAVELGTLTTLDRVRRSELLKMPKLLLNNVADYYYTSDREFWRPSDFPSCRPPFDELWYEFKMPRQIWSKARGETRMPERFLSSDFYMAGIVRKLPDGFFGMLSATYRVDFQGGRLTIEKGASLAQASYDLNDEGFISRVGDCGFLDGGGLYRDLTQDKEQLADFLYQFHPVWLAFSFANCRNVEVSQVVPPPKLQRARVRRNKEPLVSYRVINILPLSAKPSAKRTVVSDDPGSVALHIRRGHYVHYGPKYGKGLLFGKLEGMFWKEATAVGNAQAGTVVHDYKVTPKRS